MISTALGKLKVERQVYSFSVSWLSFSDIVFWWLRSVDVEEEEERIREGVGEFDGKGLMMP